jgi:transcriptional regulator with PAS, ATPase and Fis domain
MGLFLPVNLGRWEPADVEGEVFGREGEAATGGKVCVGVLGQCRPWGTVFLDEIGDLSGPLQVKLLGVLEERSFAAVGGVTPRRFGGRAVAATSRSMGELIRQGAFRENLYYRLSAGCVRVPSLALRVEQNPDELREQVEHFVRQMAEGEQAHSTGSTSSLQAGSGQVGIVERVMGVLGKRRAYEWPGNVRELEQCIRRVMLTGECSGDPSTGSGQVGVERIAAGIEHERFTAEELTVEYCRYLMGRHRAYTDAARITGLNWRTGRGMINALELR